jgi:hypothetical protein
LQAFSHCGREKKYLGCVPPITGCFARLLAQARNLAFYRKNQAFLRTINAWRAFFRFNSQHSTVKFVVLNQGMTGRTFELTSE